MRHVRGDEIREGTLNHTAVRPTLPYDASAPTAHSLGHMLDSHVTAADDCGCKRTRRVPATARDVGSMQANRQLPCLSLAISPLADSGPLADNGI